MPALSTLCSRSTVTLAIAQGLFTAAVSIDLTLTGLTGYQLAPDKSLATLPFALITVAGAITTLFAAFLMQRVGRRLGFLMGSVICALGGMVSVWSVIHQDFWMFCVGTAGVGVFQAFAQYYRLAAADAVPAQDKAGAISFVLAGGVLAAIMGPALAAWSRDLLPMLFAGSYLIVCILGVASTLLFAIVYADVAVHKSPTDDEQILPRPVATILIQPISLAAIANSVIGGAMMMLIMTAAPLAAVGCGYGINDGANIIQWHLIGMYAPSLFTGAFVRWFGLPLLLLVGIALNAVCVVIAVVSPSLAAFYVALFCLGVGWNFMFVGGSTLLARSYRANERSKVQGMAEMIRYGLTAIATLAAGPLLQGLGWATLNLILVPLLILAAILTLVWLKEEGFGGFQVA